MPLLNTPPMYFNDGSLLLCRDALVMVAEGTTTFDGISYSTIVEQLTGVMPSGSNGVNHGGTRVLLVHS